MAYLYKALGHFNNSVIPGVVRWHSCLSFFSQNFLLTIVTSFVLSFLFSSKSEHRYEDQPRCENFRHALIFTLSLIISPKLFYPSLLASSLYLSLHLLCQVESRHPIFVYSRTGCTRAFFFLIFFCTQK